MKTPKEQAAARLWEASVLHQAIAPLSGHEN
jgi:hypothetical protein